MRNNARCLSVCSSQVSTLIPAVFVNLFLLLSAPVLRLNKYNCEDHYHLIPTVTVSEVSAKSIFTCFIHFEEQSLKSNMNRSVSYSRINDRVSDCFCICFCHFSSRPNPGPHCLSEQYSRSGHIPDH